MDIGSEKLEAEAGLDNLVEKYRLLHQAPIQIMEDEDERTIRVPLIKRKEGVVA